MEDDRERGRRARERWTAALCGALRSGEGQYSLECVGERLTLRDTQQTALQLSEGEGGGGS